MSIRDCDTLLDKLVSFGLLEKHGDHTYRYTRMFSDEFADVLSKRLEHIKDRLDLLSLMGRKILISKVLVVVLLKHFNVMDRECSSVRCNDFY